MARCADPELRRWWRELMDSFDPARFTVVEFCRRHDVSVASFYQWRRKLADQDEGRRCEGAAFLPVEVVASEAAAASWVQVHLPGGVRIEVPADEKQLLWELIAQVASSAAEVRS